jgi:predicted heme/steroid binding protein
MASLEKRVLRERCTMSVSFLWEDGNHQVLHSAGVNSNVALEQAPHGAGALERFSMVGIVHEACMPKMPSTRESSD